MFNEAHISLSGYVATQPALKQTRSGIPAVTMRVAWTPRRMDRATGEWIDAGTSFATVQVYRKLAENAATCLRKGDPVVVRGRVSVRDFETRNGQQRTVVEIDAISVGHDLSHGIATFHRVRPQTGMTAAEFRAAEDAGLNGALGGAEGADSADAISAGMTGAELEPAGPRAADAGGDTSGTGPSARPGEAEDAAAGRRRASRQPGAREAGAREPGVREPDVRGPGAREPSARESEAKERALAQA